MDTTKTTAHVANATTELRSNFRVTSLNVEPVHVSGFTTMNEARQFGIRQGYGFYITQTK